MAVIDKNMYEQLKGWCDWEEGKRLHDHQIMYVNSHDRVLTDATVRKIMFDMSEEDKYGELYIALYSAENFYRNMRAYYSDVANLYMHKVGEDDPLVGIIGDLPPTCGWIILVLEDLESLSSKNKEMQKLMETVFAFSEKLSSVVLIGNGDYKSVFSGCEYAFYGMSEGIVAKEEDEIVKIDCYEQDENPNKEDVIYENPDKRRDELNFYWDTIYEQLETRYFDYENFKRLYRDTFDYIIPRITLEQVYRKDISLIENIGAMRKENQKHIEGCTPWEFDAAREFASGLHKVILNRYGYHDDLTTEKIGIHVVIKEADEACGAIHISGAYYPTINVKADTISYEMDKLSKTILTSTYYGDNGGVWRFIQDKIVEEKVLDEVPQELKEVGNNLTLLMEGIKEAADRTVNKEPGRKVRRYKGNTIANDNRQGGE